MKTELIQRILHILIALDQLAFSLITLGKAYPNETLSSAAYKGEQEGRVTGKLFRPVIDLIMFFDPMHCKMSYLDVKAGMLLPPSYKE